MMRPIIGGVLVLALALASRPVGVGAPAPLFSNPKQITNSIGMKLMRIPAGKFLMGSPADERGRGGDESPQREVTFAKTFFMGAFEVTQSEYQKVMGTNPSYCAPGGSGANNVRGMDVTTHPVENVTWHEAVAFCKKLSDLPAERNARRTYRLPTEAEWEYGCRAGTTTPFSHGRTFASTQGNFSGGSPYDAPAGAHLNRTAKVGSYKPNAWGLFDMHGNVAEWTADWHGTYPNVPETDPRGPATGTSRAVRDGAWGDPGSSCRSARRVAFTPDSRLAAIGFRVVCETAR